MLYHRFCFWCLFACLLTASRAVWAQQEEPQLDILSYPQTITAFDVSEDGTVLLVGGDGNLVLATNLLDGTPLFGIALNHGKRIDEVKISPDKTLAAILSSERHVTIYDMVHQDILMTADIGGKAFIPPFDRLEQTGGHVTERMREKLETSFLPRMTERFRFAPNRLILYATCFVTEFYLDGKTDASLFKNIQSDFQQAGFVRVKKDTFPNYCHNLPWFARYDSVLERSYETVILDPSYRYGFVHYKKGGKWFGEVWEIEANRLLYSFKGRAYLSNQEYNHTMVLSTDGKYLYYVKVDSISRKDLKLFSAIHRLDIAAKKDEMWLKLGTAGLISNFKLGIDGKHLFGLGMEGDLSSAMSIVASGNLDIQKAKKTVQNALWIVDAQTKSINKSEVGHAGDYDIGFRYVPASGNAFWGMNKEFFRVNVREQAARVAASLNMPKIKQLQMAPNGYLWVATDTDVRQFDLLSGQQTKYWPIEGDKAVDFDLSHNKVWLSDGKFVFEQDLKYGTVKQHNAPHRNDLAALLYHSPSNRLISGELLGMRSWRDNNRLLTWFPGSPPQSMSFSSSFAFKSNGIYSDDSIENTYDTIEKRPFPLLEPEIRVFKMTQSRDGLYLAANVQAKSPVDAWSLLEALGSNIMFNQDIDTNYLEEVTYNKNPYPGEIKLWKYTGGQWQEDKALDAHRDGNALERMDLVFSPDGKYLAASNQYLQIKVWDVETGRLAGLCWHEHGDWTTQRQLSHYQNEHKLHEYRTDFSITALAFSPDGQYLVSGGNDQKIVVWKRVSFADTTKIWSKRDVLPWEEPVSLTDSFVYIHDTTFYATNDGTISTIAFSLDGHYLFVGGEDGKIFIWDFQRMIPKVAIVLKHRSEGFATLTGQNLYYASPSGLDLLHFKSGNKTYPTEQFDLAYSRPNIMAGIFNWMFGDSTNTARADSIQRLYGKVVRKRLDTYGVEYDSTLAVKVSTTLPSVRILNGPELVKQQVTKATNVTVELEARSAGAPIVAVQVWVNNVPLFGRQGKRLREPSKQYTDKISVPLGQGDNKIEIGCRDNLGNESPKEQATIFCEKQGAKPNLYLIALGVDRYEKLNTPLRYAVKDGRDFIKIFKQNAEKSGRFGKIFVDTLFDEKVTTGNVKKVQDKLLKSQVDDHVQVLYSGHGMQDSLQRLFLGTTSLDLEDLAGTALPFDSLEHLLDSIPARQKLLFVDACESGLRDKTEVSRRLFMEAKISIVKKRIKGGFEYNKTLSIDTEEQKSAIDYMKKNAINRKKLDDMDDLWRQFDVINRHLEQIEVASDDIAKLEYNIDVINDEIERIQKWAEPLFRLNIKINAINKQIKGNRRKKAELKGEIDEIIYEAKQIERDLELLDISKLKKAIYAINDEIERINIEIERSKATPSGATTNQANSPNIFFAMQEMFSDLNRGTGTVVVAAASGYGKAWENDQLQNGAFTYALIHGIADSVQGYPLADLNKDGVAQPKELQQYLKVAVRRLSDGQQVPTSRAIERGKIIAFTLRDTKMSEKSSDGKNVTLVGRIVDDFTKKAIPNASIFILGCDQDVTDSQGRFQLKMSSGKPGQELRLLIYDSEYGGHDYSCILRQDVRQDLGDIPMKKNAKIPGGIWLDNSKPNILGINAKVGGQKIVALDVKQGDLIIIKAIGMIKVGLWSGSSGPEGISGPFPNTEIYNISKNFKHGALIYKLPDDTEWRLCGSNCQFTATITGTLNLALNVNDNDQGNNSGEYNVEITINRLKNE